MRKDLDVKINMPKLLIIDGLSENNKILLLEKFLDTNFIVYTRYSYALKNRLKCIDLKELSPQEEKKILVQALNNKNNIIYVTSEISDDLSYLKNEAKCLNYSIEHYISLTNDIEYIITSYEKYINKNSKLLDFQKICQNFYKRLDNYLENKEDCLFFEEDKSLDIKNVYDIIKKQIKKINPLDLDIRIKRILLNLSGEEKAKFNSICKNVIYAQLFLANNDKLYIY